MLDHNLCEECRNMEKDGDLFIQSDENVWEKPLLSKSEFRGRSPQAKYTDRTTAALRRS
jgi:hypothetical protein